MTRAAYSRVTTAVVAAALWLSTGHAAAQPAQQPDANKAGPEAGETGGAQPPQAQPAQPGTQDAKDKQAQPGAQDAEGKQAKPAQADAQDAKDKQAQPAAQAAGDKQGAGAGKDKGADAEDADAEEKAARKAWERQKRRRRRRRKRGEAPTMNSWGEDPGLAELRVTNRISRERDRRRRRRRNRRRVRPKSDSRVRIGGAFVGVGTALFFAGLGIYGDGLSGGERCGLSGCVNLINHPSRLAGEAMMIGSAVMIAGALPTLLTGAFVDDIPIRESEGQMAAGASLTLIGVGALAGGVATMALNQPDRQGRLANSNFGFFDPGVEGVGEAAIPTMVLGSIMTVIGVPLWLNGGRVYQPRLHQTPRLAQLPMMPTHLTPEVTAGAGNLSLRWRLQ